MENHPRAIRADVLLAEMDWVQRLARSLVRDPSLADDIAQDAWLQALERPPRHARTGPGLRAWLARVTRTLARQSMRSESRRTAREHTAARSESEASTAEIVARGSMHRRLVEAVMSLDEPSRSSILYRYLDGMSAPEIAERCGASHAAVRQRLSRGLVELRSRLDREFGGDRSAWSAVLIPTSSVHIAGASIVAKTAASLSALQVLGVLAACAGVVFVISRSVRTDPAAISSAAAPLVEQASPQREASEEAPAPPVLRTPAAAEPEIPAAAPATVAGPERAASELDAVAETFMTEQPDILGMMGALRTAVRNAKVLPDTVNRSDEDGAVRGEISVAGMEGKASFMIRGMRYRVTFESAQTSRPDRFRRDLAVWIRDDHGQAADPGVMVQYFPVYKDAVKDLPPESEQKVMGWGLNALPDGIHAYPITMRRGAEQGEMVYGRPKPDFPRIEPGASDLATFDAWFRLLQPYAK
jgi:RNA polymerase sigma-70 factor (ECF subfamily)